MTIAFYVARRAGTAGQLSKQRYAVEISSQKGSVSRVHPSSQSGACYDVISAVAVDGYRRDGFPRGEFAGDLPA